MEMVLSSWQPVLCCVVCAVLPLRPVSEPNYLIITFFMSISDPLLIIMAIIWRRRTAFSFILSDSDYRVQLWNNISVWRWKIVSSDTLLRHQQTTCGQFATWSPFVSVTWHSTLGWSRKEDDMTSNYKFWCPFFLVNIWHCRSLWIGNIGTLLYI